MKKYLPEGAFVVVGAAGWLWMTIDTFNVSGWTIIGSYLFGAVAVIAYLYLRKKLSNVKQ